MALSYSRTTCHHPLVFFLVSFSLCLVLITIPHSYLRHRLLTSGFSTSPKPILYLDIIFSLVSFYFLVFICVWVAFLFTLSSGSFSYLESHRSPQTTTISTQQKFNLGQIYAQPKNGSISDLHTTILYGSSPFWPPPPQKKIAQICVLTFSNL